MQLLFKKILNHFEIKRNYLVFIKYKNYSIIYFTK